MKRNVLLLIISIFSLKAFSQDKSLLRSYSVPIDVKLNGKRQGNGSGFYIRSGLRVFLISNYHMFTGQLTNNGKQYRDERDELEVPYITYTGLNRTYKINIKKIVAESKPYKYYDHPDIYAFEVTHVLPEGIKILSIENLIRKIPRNKKPKDIICYGFGMSKFNELHLKSFNSVYDNQKIAVSTGKEVLLTNSYFLLSESTGGMSGSPVFNIYENDQIYFAGVLSTYEKMSKRTLIVKPQEVSNLLKEALKIK